jgi:hypothetical protein
VSERCFVAPYSLLCTCIRYVLLYYMGGGGRRVDGERAEGEEELWIIFGRILIKMIGGGGEHG